MATLLNDCGCCEGITAIVPDRLTNRPGLSQVRYRVGTHAEFLASALAALSDPQFNALRSLTTREPDDFTIALLDGWATVADVLTFYQERIANELWLRTATERDSILRLAQLIGYRLKPGVAAETPLAFLLDETPGAPTEVAIKLGTKVQSVPGADEKPQTFETIEEIEAQVQWNALKPLLTTPAVVGATSLYLKGTATNLLPGDPIVFIGAQRDLRILLTVTPDSKNNWTHVTWETALGQPPSGLAAADIQVYALRQRAALFGHNAPDPTFIALPDNGAVGSWGSVFDNADNPIDLDSAYSKIVAKSWIALVSNSATEIYRATSVSFPTRVAFALSAKVTRIVPEPADNPASFKRLDTIVYAQSELQAMTSGPLVTPAVGSLGAALTLDPNLLAPIEGSVIELDRLIPVLEGGSKVALTGKLLRVRVATTSLTLTSLDKLETTTVTRGKSLTLSSRPTLLPWYLAKWTLRTDEGFEGTVITWRNSLVLTPALDSDAALSELALVKECVGDPSVLTLQSPLAQLYDRATVTLSANVADATHGETVTEVLGSGNGAQPGQSFKLKQAPALTYTRSTAPGGAESSLQIRVNDLLWQEVPTLFERTSRERIFTTELADSGTVTVRFGDGERGARLPSGAQNVKAIYRRGIGLEGLVRAGQLTTLLTRPPGLKSAINPLAAEGADEPESFANAQQNAPLTVLTLDRVVSLEDYENFSRSYAGIAKALATWTWDGRTRGVFITVAGPLGADISTTLAQDLIAAIHSAGDPFVPVRVVSYDEAHFRMGAGIKIDPDYETEKVLAAANDALRNAFSFEERQFGQPVVLSEVIALVQSIAGVVAVDVNSLYRGTVVKLSDRLEADLPNGGNPESLGAAELLTLDPAPIELEAMP